MSTYIMSDLHGNYDAYMKLLEIIRFSPSDMLYILGDILDRGPHPIRIIQDLMARPNVVCLAGNHEHMALACLPFLMQEITEDSLEDFNQDRMEQLLNWQENGSATTIEEFSKLTRDAQQAVIDFIADFELYEEVQVNGEIYILVHAGLGNFRPARELWDYDLVELVGQRPDYDKPYFPDKYVITGHTPTMAIPNNPRPGQIYRCNRHIAIDCGAGFGGKLACLCLETGQEFYADCL